MADVYHQLAQIKTLAYELVQKYEEALNENESLQKTLAELNDELMEKNRKLTLLEGELQTARIARGLTSDDDEKHLAKARINTLVREIDRCIALLNE